MARPKTTNIGDRLGKLTVVSLYRERRKSGDGWRYMCELECDCGGRRVVERGALHSASFNYECLNCSGNSGGRLAHGHSISRKDIDPIGYACYTRWQAIKRRCFKEYDSRYSSYGGRGITMCKEWASSYEAFLNDMGLPPTIEHQIDRIDNDGDYEPSNCRWTTRVQNSRNKRNSKFITANGVTMTQAEWAEKTGIKREAIAMRIRRGWSAEKALGLCG